MKAYQSHHLSDPTDEHPAGHLLGIVHEYRFPRSVIEKRNQFEETREAVPCPCPGELVSHGEEDILYHYACEHMLLLLRHFQLAVRIVRFRFRFLFLFLFLAFRFRLLISFSFVLGL